MSVLGRKQIKKDAFDNVCLTNTQIEPYQQMLIMVQAVIEMNFENQFDIADQRCPTANFY